MSLTDELQKLADLRAAGQLSPEEFAEAKRRLLAQAPDFPSPPTVQALANATIAPRVAEKTYWSSRWSAGNMFFRDSITLASDGLLFKKGRMFGSQDIPRSRSERRRSGLACDRSVQRSLRGRWVHTLRRWGNCPQWFFRRVG